MTKRTCCIAFVLAMAGCGPPAQQQGQAPQKKAAEAAAKPSDESRRFPVKDRIKIELVDNNLLGKNFLPGGNLAEYRLRRKTYQQFLIRAATPDKAAFLLLDYKNALAEAKFVPHMGAFYGRDGDKPVYVLQKGVFLAGFVGLEEREAEPLAREFAARLN
jgi:hypothetical protein